MTLSPQSSCLLLIDFQTRLMPAILDAPLIVSRAQLLADAARRLELPIYATEQNRAGLGETVHELQGFAPFAFQKQHFDVTREPSWIGFLPKHCEHIIVCGAEAHVCVLQSVRGLLQQGRKISIVKDAVGSRTIADRNAGLHRMERHGAELVTTEMVLFEWLQTCNHPQFREVLAMIKNTGSGTQKNEHDSRTL